jgi:hypothetical protein
VLFAVLVDPSMIFVSQLLDGVTGSIMTILTALVVADLTTGTGRFNLTQGMVGTLTATAAALSTGVSGFMVHQIGDGAGFLLLACVTTVALVVLWLFFAETKPEKYVD